MSELELQQVLPLTVKKIAHKVGITVMPGENLRSRRKEKQQYARLNKGWTLFINKKGSLCHAVFKTGAVQILEAPEHVHDCFHEEHAINYFVNHMRSISKGFHS